MNKYHDIGNVRLIGDVLFLIIDGEERSFRLTRLSPLFAEATEPERNTFEISPSGYGIHWPLLNEDISIDALLGISHAPEGRQRKIA